MKAARSTRSCSCGSARSAASTRAAVSLVALVASGPGASPGRSSATSSSTRPLVAPARAQGLERHAARHREHPGEHLATLRIEGRGPIPGPLEDLDRGFLGRALVAQDAQREAEDRLFRGAVELLERALAAPGHAPHEADQVALGG